MTSDPANLVPDTKGRYLDSMGLLAGLLALVIVPPALRLEWQRPCMVALLTA